MIKPKFARLLNPRQLYLCVVLIIDSWACSESGLSAVDKRFMVSVRCSIRLEVWLFFSFSLSKLTSFFSLLNISPDEWICESLHFAGANLGILYCLNIPNATWIPNLCGRNLLAIPGQIFYTVQFSRQRVFVCLKLS